VVAGAELGRRLAAHHLGARRAASVGRIAGWLLVALGRAALLELLVL
jgi:hypothetical protein